MIPRERLERGVYWIRAKESLNLNWNSIAKFISIGESILIHKNIKLCAIEVEDESGQRPRRR